MECAKVHTGIRKVKKKQVKDELDRIKLAEKKKRRLEKALATSAAIRSELEKKKQKKKEEQQRLDEEGAAVAEAVALHVLLGEDSEDSHHVMLKKDEGFTSWDHGSNFDLIMGRRPGLVPDHELSKYSLEGVGWFSDAQRYGYMWSHQGNSDWIVPSNPWERDFKGQYFEEEGWDAAGLSPGVLAVQAAEEDWDAAGLSPGVLAAQAVSSLQIADDSQIDTYVFNRMLNG